MLVDTLFLDTETRSREPIKRGTYRYATQAEVMVVTWACDNGPKQCWDRTANPVPPAALVLAMQTCRVAKAHKAEFDRTLLKRVPELPQIPLTKWRCTMAKAYAHGLPGGLDKLATVYSLPAAQQKDTRGKKLIQLFCIPRKKDGGYNDRHSHPAEWAQFLDYAVQDIETMRAVDRLMPTWNESEFEIGLWHLDQDMNDRGVCVDLDLATSAIAAVEIEAKKLKARTSDLTLGVVDRPTQRDKLLRFLLLAYGVELPDMTADTLERRLDDPELPAVVKELLHLRLRASKSSTSKYTRVLSSHVDGYLRGLLQFCGALRTGRWAGRIFQPQNLPRLDLDAVRVWAGLPEGEDLKVIGRCIPAYLEATIAAFKAGSIDLVSDNVMLDAANLLRSLIIAAPGSKLVVSDLANIEGRMLAWLSGEEWKLEAFRAFDRKEGPDLYKVAFARAFNKDPETIADEGNDRQVGKVQELSLGFYGSVGAFAAMAVTYSMELDDMAEQAWETLPERAKVKGQERWAKEIAKKKPQTYDLAQRTYIVCYALVWLWRQAHPATVAFWHDIESAVRKAIANPNVAFTVRSIVVDKKGTWLRIRLPSGRYLCYPSPRVGTETVDGETRSVISYMGVDQYTKQWKRIKTYSGKLVENITQASARDVLAYGLVAANEEGYSPRLTVHDEIICQPPDLEEFNDKHLSSLLATVPVWCEGLPLAAKGHTSYRYVK